MDLNYEVSLADCVYLLATLPQHPPILLTETSEQKLFLGMRFRYKALSLWLRHFLLGEALAEEVFLTNMRHFQGIAELMAAEFHLATAVYPRSTNLLIRRFDSPASLWFYCQLVMSQQCLDDVGLTDLPKPKGKRESLTDCLKMIDGLKNLGFPHRECSNIEYITGILIAEAQKLAKTNPRFRQEHFMPYLRVFKRSVNKDKNCKQLQSAYLLPDGQIFWTGKSYKLPKLKGKEL